jgi:type I restriction enzyme S subunit
MTPQELKNSILQLAIQGKLVEQRPEEGVAEVPAALQHGGREARRHGEIEPPFDIPESWRWVRFGNAITLLSGTDFPPDQYNNQGVGIPYITGASSLSETGVLVNRWTKTPRIIAKRGDILLVCKGSGYGKTVVCDIDEAHIARQIMAVQQTSSLDMQYVRYFLMANFQLIKSKGQGVIPGIDRKSVLQMMFPLPPLSEQKRIVSKIEELLPLLARYEQAWTKLEAFNTRFPSDLQKSLLQLAIQGKLVPQLPEEGVAQVPAAPNTEKKKARRHGEEIEPPFDIPESWRWVEFLSVVEIATNLVKPTEYANYKHIAPDNIEKGTGRLLQCRTVAEDKVTSANHRFFTGQIIYSKIRPLLRKVVIAPFDGLCSADMYPINVKIDSRFLLYYMLSDAFNLQISQAMSSRVKMPKINQNELAKVLVPLPPLAEQKRIVAKLEELLPLCERLK